MQIHQIKSNTKRSKPVKVGRGGKRGKTSGRGTKGQKARSGRKMRPELRDIIKKIPKLRGRGKNINKAFAFNTAVNLIEVERNFENGEKVSPQTLYQKDVIRKISGKLPSVKIVGKTELTKKVTFKNCLVSESAKAVIEKSGSRII